MTIGWYVHHHGRGHLTRFEAVRPLVAAPVVVFSSLPEPSMLPEATTWVQLPRDDGDEGAGAPSLASPTASGMLHWAPVGHVGHAKRLAAIADHAAELASMVVDVSVEVTMLARLLGVPVALVTQPGARHDTPHVIGQNLADAIIAPWPAAGGESAQGSHRERTETRIHYVGGISRFADAPMISWPTPSTVLALGGGGRDAEWRELVQRAAEASREFTWTLADADAWLDDPWLALREADVVVSAAGQNAIADIAAAGARAVVIPRPRPFGEQRATACMLDAMGLAVVLDALPADVDAASDCPSPARAEADDTGLPSAESLVAAVRRARLLEPRWEAWQTTGAPMRAAQIIAGVAGVETRPVSADARSPRALVEAL